MFIHFGIYSELGGVWDDRQISRGLSEQIQAHAGIYSDVYARVAKQFNPIKWNADSIATLAKAAGMGSIVITSKHHDGFAMFNSAHTDFDVVDATPYGKDILKELSEACKRHHVKFGLYFSLIDWYFPQASPISSHNSDYITPEHHIFNKKQVTELLSNYGEVSELWFDMGSMSVDQSTEMRELVHRLQPNCMIGSRVGNDMGDFTVMGDNQEPDYIIGVPWQSPASFFDETWGYRSWQKRTDAEEKMKEKLTSLIRVTSRGGNFLLNIGPRGDGTVVEYEKEILLRIGKWLSQNKEAIYGTSPDPFHVSFDWGSITSRSDRLYLHILKVPATNEIRLPGLTGKIKKAYVIGSKINCRTQSHADHVSIEIPKSLPAFSVIALEFTGQYAVPHANVISPSANTITLNSSNAFKYFSNSGIDYNTRYTSTIRALWTIQTDRSSSYVPELIYSEEEKGKEIVLSFNGVDATVTLSGDEPVKLINDQSSLKTSTVYLQGPFWSGIERAHGPVDKISPALPWADQSGKAWVAQTEWKNGNVYKLPGDLNTAYYFLQEIEVAREKTIAAKFIAGDALVVWLNGKQQYVHNNPFKEDSISHVLLLELKPGKNQVLVKSFNHFHKQILFGIDYNVPQVMYRKQLSPVRMAKGIPFEITWKLYRPFTPHEDMGLPNLKLQLTDRASGQK
jgi:alpha-L-fucosidase